MHNVTYTINDSSLEFPQHDIQGPIEAAEFKQLAEQGFLIKESFFNGARLQQFQNAIDQISNKLDADNLGSDYNKDEQFVRDLPLQDELFADLVIDKDLVNIAKLLLGPLLRFRGSTARISRPGCLNTGFGWHIHQRHNLEPAAPWHSTPHGVDYLIYLDDVNEDNGQIAVLPGSHLDTQRRITWDSQEEFDDQIKLSPPAGSLLIMHPNLWHCSKPALKVDEHQRRLIIVGYVPSWYRSCPHNKRDKREILELYPDKKELHDIVLAQNYT